ncbi:STAS domain-containing protein [uncultured Methylobacterium sp.]|uniref:STAS domain-containing protein n=1 Tax=uncultured Methylobacterium sp. TaxID=157278 RepID=UPI0025913D4D|nr:STAS domain-containing protein [uncultured Methylobacterium sp.]
MSDRYTLTLPDECDIRNAAEIQARLGDALAAGPVDVDGEGVVRADVTFVQVVLAAVGTARRSGGSLRVTGLSAAASAAFDRAGVPLSDLAPPLPGH